MDRKIKTDVDIKDVLVKKLIKKQKKDINSDIKLTFKDMTRVCKHINTDPFDKKQCCLWTGNITNMNNHEKGRYVNFYFNGKKQALHRLLYSNFVGILASDEYLKYKCENKGICCNINHFEKYSDDNLDDDNIQTRTDKNIDDVIIERNNTS